MKEKMYTKKVKAEFERKYTTPAFNLHFPDDDNNKWRKFKTSFAGIQ